MPTPYPLSEEDIKTFHQDGALCLRQVFNSEAVAGLRTAVDTAMHQPGPQASDFASDEGGQFFADLFVWTRVDPLRDWILTPYLGAIAGRLMGTRQVRFFFDHLLVKEPGAAAPTPWHQDAPYWPIAGGQCLSIWIALDPVSKANGRVEYIRGSHTSGKLYASQSFRGDGRVRNPDFHTMTDALEELPDIDANRDDYDIISWDLAPGDVVVHHIRTIHGAPGNLTNSDRRRGLATRWIGDDIVYKNRAGVPVPMSKSLSQLAPMLKEGARLDGPVFPLVWQNSDGVG